jgi:hypothetical protein
MKTIPWVANAAATARRERRSDAVVPSPGPVTGR